MSEQEIIEQIALKSGFKRSPQGQIFYAFGDSGYLQLDDFFKNLIRNAFNAGYDAGKEDATFEQSFIDREIQDQQW